MRQYPLIHLLAFVLAASLLMGHVVRAQESNADRVAAIKAGMMINFVRYATWPETSFEKDDSPIVVTIVGDADIDEALTEAAGDLLINKRSMQIQRVEYPLPSEGEDNPRPEDLSTFHETLRTSHAVYFGASEAERTEELLDALKAANVLTVSDIHGFAEKGGMLGLTIRDRRVAFDANEGAIKETEVQVSSQVLKLARIVETTTRNAAEEGS